ncbi:MAG: ABC transporter substrate-binding protein [Halapricum sp.]
MTENKDFSRDGRIDRRKFIGGVGAGVAVGMAGCSGQEDEATTSTETDTEDEDGGMDDTDTDTEASGEPMQGGTYTFGMASPPNNLNILATGTAYAFVVLDAVYCYGTTLHPETQEVIPYGFADWSLNVDNVGSDSNPTMTATLQEGLMFNDGEPVTAEDVKFSIEYIQEQEPAGSISASEVSSVSKVEVAGDGADHDVEFYLSEKDAGWATSILGVPFMPEHIWGDVDDYSKYNPRKDDAGVVGSGMMQLGDFNWENWYELEMRDPEMMPWLDDWDFLDEGAPFIDALRIEIFGSANALHQALLNAEIDQTYGSLPVDKAAQATENDQLDVIQGSDDGWAHHSWNMRRKPFDDKTFRRFLVKALDWEFVVEDLYKGIGAVKGDYGTPPVFDAWRPDVPEEIDTHEGTLPNDDSVSIDMPDLLFPEATRGNSNLNDEAMQEMRQFLTEADDAAYDYTFEEADSDVITSPDGKMLHVDGERLDEAHTDNDGNSGQGPLEMSYNPPSDSPLGARRASNWLAVLKETGIPARGLVQSFNSQLPKVYQNHDFDMFEMGWTGLTVTNDHYSSFFGSDGIGDGGFNPMAYTGADEYIDMNGGMMELEPRQPVVQAILAQIWHDAPTLVTNYDIILQPVTNAWTGHVNAVGGVTNELTWPNVHKMG